MVQESCEVVILGAGVIGLQTALSLLHAGYKVTLVAKHWPGDENIEYTSPWAGAHWRTHAGPDEDQIQRWDSETFQAWSKIIEEMGRDKAVEETGLAFTPAVYYFNERPANESIWWSSTVRDFRLLLKPYHPEMTSSLPSPEPAAIAYYTTITIAVPTYLGYLLSQLGAYTTLSTITAEVDTLTDVFLLPGVNPNIRLMVNCTGLASRELVPDETVYPATGQTVLVAGEAERVTFVENEDPMKTAYVIPRIGEGTTVLGGTKSVNDWSHNVDQGITTDILERCKMYIPELCTGLTGGLEVLSSQKGRRPARKAGPRVCREDIAQGSRFIVHSYGHAGAGFQNSIGSANDVVRLVDEALRK